jgi:hypothetical protein
MRKTEKALLESKYMASVWCCESTDGKILSKYCAKLIIGDVDK